MNYLIELIPLYVNAGCVFFIYLGCLWLFVWKGGIEKRLTAFVSRFLLGEYLITLFSITVSPMYGFSFPKLSGTLNVVPFRVLSTVVNNPMNFFGNVLLFIPLGVIIVFLSKKYWRVSALLIGPCLSILIEVIQLFNIRGTDVDDVILNSIGYVIGWLFGVILIQTSSFLRRCMLKESKSGQERTLYFLQNAGVIIMLALGIIMVAGVCDLREYNQISIDTSNNEMKTFQEYQLVKHSENNRCNDIELDIKAKSAILICQETGETLWQKDAYEKMAPASCTKILNAMVVLDYCDPTEVIVVGDELQYVAHDATRSFIYKGYELTVRQALIAMLLPSGNDAAYVLAAYTGEKIADDSAITTGEAVSLFVEKMNEKAKKVGATSSNFTTPDGYDEKEQYTTAYDLAVISAEAMKNEVIAEIVRMPQSRERWISGEVAEYENTNEMLFQESDYYVANCTGLKTGTTSNAGACLVSSFSVENRNFISVILQSTREERFRDSVKIYDKILVAM